LASFLRVFPLAALVPAACAAPLERHEFAESHMGTQFRIVLYSAERSAAERAAAEAFARIAGLERALSDYDPESELERLGRSSDGPSPGPPVTLSQDLWRVLAEAQQIARATEGAFDVTVGPYVRLWRRARRQGQLPAPERLAAAARSVGYDRLELEPGQRTARLLAHGMRLDLGGIAKGFALDEALAVLERNGIRRALVDGGGDLLAGEPPPGRRGWRVALVGCSSTSEQLELARGALATSGDLERYVELEGKRYSHIVDPRSGLALEKRWLVSVHAPTGILADALATALSVLGAPDGLAVLERFTGASARIVLAVPGGEQVFRSSAFPRALSCGDPAPLPEPMRIP
jgi:thiamine biosynthesis lipoprotein